MANTIPAEIVTAAYDAMEVVSQELIGLIPAVSKNAKAETVSLNQNITAPVVGAKTSSQITPGHAYSDPADQSIGFVSVEMTKQQKTEFHWTGEQERELMNSDGVLMDINRQNIAQCLRTLVNEIETDLAAEYVNASRAFGTLGATPFGTNDDLSDLSGVLRILDENGAPPMGRSVILNELTARQLQGKQPTLFNVNEGGEMRRSFNPIMLFGSMVRMSHAIHRHDSGTALPNDTAINDVNDVAVGSTTIGIDGTSIPAQAKGDIITFGDDPDNKYVLAQDKVAGNGNIVIAKPGLRIQANDNRPVVSAVTDYTANMAFSMDALMLACRVPAVPEGGDLGMRTYLQDPRSGLVFELATFPQYRQRTYEVGIVWGVKTIKPEHMAILIG